jgi:hypothetical protein
VGQDFAHCQCEWKERRTYAKEDGSVTLDGRQNLQCLNVILASDLGAACACLTTVIEHTIATPLLSDHFSSH